MSRSSSRCETITCNLATLGRKLAGLACLVGGLAMTLTLWLAVAGIPLALFGVALIASDQSHTP